MHVRSILLLPLATLAIYACSDAETEATGAPAGYGDVLLEGAVTDETLVAFVQALEKGPPADVPSKASVFDWPANGEMLPRNPPPAFSWHLGDTARRERAAANERWASLQPFTAKAPADLVSPLRDLFGPPRVARAHGDPYNGVATYLVFSIDADPKLARSLTSNTTFTPSQAAWDKMAATGKPITVKLVSAFFEQNRIGPEDGPVAGATIQFTISP